LRACCPSKFACPRKGKGKSKTGRRKGDKTFPEITEVVIGGSSFESVYGGASKWTLVNPSRETSNEPNEKRKVALGDTKRMELQRQR